MNQFGPESKVQGCWACEHGSEKRENYKNYGFEEERKLQSYFLLFMKSSGGCMWVLLDKRIKNPWYVW